MKDLVVVCCGSFGLEVYVVANKINAAAIERGEEPPYNILGFIDDNYVDMKEKYGIEHGIIGTIKNWEPKNNEVFAIGAAKPVVKEKLTNILKARGAKFETLIAPWSIVSPNCKMGEGCFVTAYSISSGVELGDFVNINGSMICPGAVIEDYCTTTGFSVVEDAHLCKKVFVGSHAVVKSGVVVGEGADISAGSMIVTDVNPGVLMFGVPAIEIG